MRRLEQWNRRKLSRRTHTGNEQRATGSARCGRGRRFFTRYLAILMAETEPLMQACYSFVKEHCSAGLNCSLSCYRVATRGISKGTASGMLFSCQ